MKRFTALLFGAALVFCTPAWAAISLQLAANYDATRTTQYPTGNKPVAGCTSITTDGFTQGAVGDGSGEGCKAGAGDYDFNALGSNTIQNSYLAYKDAGAADVQIEGRITDTFAGSTDSGAGIGIGLRESTSSTSWVAQCKSLQSNSTAIQCQYGLAASPTDVNCSASGTTRPVYLGVSYDLSSTTVKGFTSSNGTTWTECFSTTRAMSDVIGYIIVGSKSTTVSLAVTLDNFALGSTIDFYTPTDPPAGSPPVLVSAIPDQTGTQNTAFSLTFSAYFTGATSYSLGSAFPGALTESSDGVLSGTPNATDVSSSPYSRDLCATNVDGTTCDSVSFSFSPPAGSGDVFTAPDIADSTSSTFTCNTTGGANGSSWASIRTSGSGTTVGPGDTIEITSGQRGKIEFKSCSGNASNFIKIRKTASATRLQVNASSGDGFLCRNCEYVLITGLENWTGQGSGCGADASLSETPLTDCGILVKGGANFATKTRENAQHVIFEGFELDGDWPRTATETGGDVGFSPNDQAYCVDTFYDGLIFRKNYVHDYAHELVYMGSNVTYSNCPLLGNGASRSPRLMNAEIADNFMEFGGWDGVNLKSAIAGTNIVQRNVILHIGGGTTSSGANSVGIALFESEGIIRYNKIRDTNDPPGGASGLVCSANQAPSAWGTLDCQIYGNDVSDTDGNCININRGGGAGADRSGDIFNNTVTDCGASGIRVDPNVTGGVVIRDNIAAGESISLPSGNGNSQSNNNTVAEASQGFVDAGNNDYRLTSGSGARNAGSSNCPSIDIIGVSRPQGSQCDQGAYEFDE